MQIIDLIWEHQSTAVSVLILWLSIQYLQCKVPFSNTSSGIWESDKYNVVFELIPASVPSNNLLFCLCQQKARGISLFSIGRSVKYSRRGIWLFSFECAAAFHLQVLLMHTFEYCNEEKPGSSVLGRQNAISNVILLYLARHST